MRRFCCCLHFGILLLLLGHPSSSTTSTVTAFQQIVSSSSRGSRSKTSRTAAAAALYHASSAAMLKRPVIHCWGSGTSSLSLLMSSSSSSSPSNKEDSSSNNDDHNNNKLQKKINGRKKRVLVGYRIAGVIYSMITIAMLLGPTCKHGISMLPMAGNYAAGPLMAASFCYILHHAAAAQQQGTGGGNGKFRMSSETYKRINLYLSQYGAVYLAAAILVKLCCCSAGGPPLTGGTKKLLSPVLLLASLVSFVNGLKGWSYGAKGGWGTNNNNSNRSLFLLAKDFVDVFFTSWIRILAVIPRSLASLGFLAATIFATSLTIVTLVEIIFGIFIPEILATLATSGTTLMSITSAGLMASKMIQFTRLSLLSSICLTLKDAADRSRLTGTTFIQLSALSTFTFAFMAANSHFAIIKDVGTTKTTLVTAAAALFSVFSAVIGLVSIRIKNKESSKFKKL